MNHTEQIKNTKLIKFSEEPKIHYMFTYSYANRQARNGSSYLQDACDRLRFRNKIKKFSEILTPVLLKKIREM